MDISEDVSLDAYLASRRPMPHLFDLVLPRALRPGRSQVDVTTLASAVRERGEPQCDVRLLVSDADLYLTAASELADTLRCDVYLPPPQAHVRYVRESSPVTGESWDAVAVRTETGEPTPWLLVRPDERADTVPSWFVSTGGRLRQNAGLITVPLARGLAFATASSFPEAATLARDITSGPSGVTTLAVTADIGRFEISRFNEASALLGGVEFATLVAASLDLIEPDVQLALAWPVDKAAGAALDVELMRFADALNRTVWVPKPAGAASVLHGRGEFGALDHRGRPSTWHAYASRLDTRWQPGYGTDDEGRLTPLDELAGRASSVKLEPGDLDNDGAEHDGTEHDGTEHDIDAPDGNEYDGDAIGAAVRLAERSARRPVFMPASPTVLLATLGPRPAIIEHCVSWLSPSVVVNQDAVELYVWMPAAAAHAENWALSSPDVFLLADTDPQRLAEHTRSGQLLGLTAPARTAVDLCKHSDQAPAALRRRIEELGSTHLLPLAWIGRYQLTTRFDVDSSGRVGAGQEVAPDSIEVRFDGAEHGIPGLPNDVVHWPAEDQRSDTPSYLIASDPSAMAGSTDGSAPGFVALSRERPPLPDQCRVMEVRVRRRHAIDVPATLRRLAALPVSGRLREFADFDVLLSEQDFSKAVVSKVWRRGPDGEPEVDKLLGETLSDVFPDAGQ